MSQGAIMSQSEEESDNQQGQESTMQKIDAKFEQRFQHIEAALLRSLVKSNKCKERDDDSKSDNEPETSAGRDQSSKRTKRDTPKKGNDSRRVGQM